MNEATKVLLGTRVRGDIRGASDLVVEGRLDGAIHVDGDLVIRESGVVRGDVRARSVRVLGVVVGSIVANDRISVSSSARIAGDLTAPDVDVDASATFRGNVDRRPSEPPVAPAEPGVLWDGSPRSMRPVPRRPPSAIMPSVGRSQGRMRHCG